MKTVVSVSTSLRGAYRPKPFCKCMRLVAHYINYNLINVSNEGAHMSLFDFVCQECVCIFVLEGDSRLLCDDPPYEVPQEGKLRCVPFVSAYTELQMFFSAGGWFAAAPPSRAVMPREATKHGEEGGSDNTVLSTWKAGATWMKSAIISTQMETKKDPII